jgi:hypothetical protein
MKILDRFFGANTPPPSKKGPPLGPRPETVERNNQIVADRRAGMRTDELCQKYQLGSHSILVICRGIRVSNPLPPRTVSPRNEEIIEKYMNGATATALGIEYGLSRERVCQFLRPLHLTETRIERRRIAREAIEKEAADIKAQAKAEFGAKAAEAVELIRGGLSISEACRKIGLTAGQQMALVRAACEKAGVESRHGRWRDFGPKIARVRELRAENKVWSEIDRICVIEGHGSVYGAWIQRHCPDLVIGRRLREPSPPSAPKVPKQSPPDPNVVWTEERVRVLLDCWFRGISAMQCADVLGPPITKNAVIGKINRLRGAGLLKPPQNDLRAEAR